MWRGCMHVAQQHGLTHTKNTAPPTHPPFPSSVHAEAPSSSDPADPLAWLPATYAAVALRLQSLDACLMYSGSGSGRDCLGGYLYVTRPAPHLRLRHAEGGGARESGGASLSGTPVGGVGWGEGRAGAVGGQWGGAGCMG